MRHIAVFTGTRAEYSLLYFLLKYLQDDADINLQLFVGGTHLSNEFGHTIDQIISDGFSVTEKLDFLLPAATPNAISKSLALAITTTADAIVKHCPDVIVVLGDRYEALGVAQAAMINQTPIVHIHGGEITEGAYDDAIRHAITKLAQLHFTATEPYRNRVIQLGEQPEHVFNVGAPGIDSIKQLTLLSRDELSEYFAGKLVKPYFLVTYHPVTLSKAGAIEGLKNLLLALDSFEDYQIIITYPNADSFGNDIIEHLQAYAKQHQEKVLLVKSLGQLRYLSAIKHAEAVIGNTSSGIIEVPSLHVPTVNIGDRQKGRIASGSVIHCANSVADIHAAIRKAISSEFKSSIASLENPYGQGGASKAIYNTLKSFELSGIIQKTFFNLPVQ
jgi:UDP-hydrolysing UDP-N-acetyl-D-glucosamine 2-epimerase